MKRSLLCALLVVLLVGASASAQYGSSTDFQALMRRVLAAWGTLDLHQVAPFYAQEPNRLFFDTAPLKYTGWSEYAEGAKTLFADFASLKLTLNPDAQVQQRGNTAWGAATVRADIGMKNGATQSFDARWTVVWEKRGKNWIIVHDHFSGVMPYPEDAATQSLYRRLGGYDALAAVTDDFLGRLIADRQLRRFFGGVSADSQKRIRQLVVDQLCAATGGPCFYTGRSMKASHQGLGITEADWKATVNHLVATLDAFKVPPNEKEQVLKAIGGMKADIVNGAHP